MWGEGRTYYVRQWWQWCRFVRLHNYFFHCQGPCHHSFTLHARHTCPVLWLGYVLNFCNRPFISSLLLFKWLQLPTFLLPFSHVHSFLFLSNLNLSYPVSFSLPHKIRSLFCHSFIISFSFFLDSSSSYPFLSSILLLLLLGLPSFLSPFLIARGPVIFVSLAHFPPLSHTRYKSWVREIRHSLLAFFLAHRSHLISPFLLHYPMWK